MTNAEKYLKDGEDGIKPLLDKCREIGAIDSGREYRIYQMLREEVKPTLTEDERVILRNIKNVRSIKRDNEGDLVIYKIYAGIYYITEYNHLFQFIKERRRIRDKGVVK